MLTREALLREIHIAFENTPRPEDDKIIRGQSLEGKMIKYFLAPRSWKEVNADVLCGYDQRADLSAMICFLSAEGFRYYLPAFLLFVILEYKRAGILIDVLISKLASGSDGFSSSDFSQQQCRSVYEFLQYLRESHSDDELMCKEIELALKVWHA